MRAKRALGGLGAVLVLAVGGWADAAKVSVPKPAVTAERIIWAAPNPVPRPVKITVIGDSITYGQEDGQSWRAIMSSMLRARGLAPNWTVLAYGGARCEHWASPSKNLIAVNDADIVIVSCGTNDDQATPALESAFTANHRMLIDHGQLETSKVMVSTIQISRVTGRPDLAWLPGFEVKTNAAIRANVAAEPDVAFADLEAIPATLENNPDGVHPGPAGMVLYAAAWISAGAAKGWWAP